jgi:hypothetical protein
LLVAGQKVPRDFFIGRIGLERIAPGKINQLDLVAMGREKSPGFPGHGGTGIVAHLLILPGEGVEESRFPGVGISNQGDARRGARFTHQAGTTLIWSARALLTAKRVPQTVHNMFRPFVILRTRISSQNPISRS